MGREVKLVKCIILINRAQFSLKLNFIYIYIYNPIYYIMDILYIILSNNVK